MKAYWNYDRETDTFRVRFMPTKYKESVKIERGLFLELDEENKVMGLLIMNASKFMNKTKDHFKGVEAVDFVVKARRDWIDVDLKIKFNLRGKKDKYEISIGLPPSYLEEGEGNGEE